MTIHADEVATLNAEFAREGSKTGGMLRSLWIGSDVGMTNADRDRNVSIPANMARLAAIWGVQPYAAQQIMAQARTELLSAFSGYLRRNADRQANALLWLHRPLVRSFRSRCSVTLPRSRRWVPCFPTKFGWTPT
ncbi:hypothetical protein MMAGJ_78290 [Mycolicibacterium mageritense]|uniref:Uncharacterized protein n=1 Tax=Mycolicibacterium mageritense TaxID=53462 RepID=A0ABN5YML2_MYCME|nr:hypothetical protein MMAGJ_78290 [Mycolicibacterium mageritense]